MKIRLSDLWQWNGTVDRFPYALIGVVGFAIKHNLDRFVALIFFHRRWDLFNYWIPPTKAVRIRSLPHEDAALLGTLLALALPFIWTGVVLTLRRLRAVGLPTWLVAVFFLPVVNLVFFALLSIFPSRPAEGYQGSVGDARTKRPFDRLIPESPVGSAAMAVFLTVAFGAVATVFATSWLATYAWGLFVALPFCLGLASVLLYGYHRQRSYASCLLVASLSTILLGFALLALAIEGAICLLMATPIALVISWIGGSMGYVIQCRPWSRAEAPTAVTVLILFVPTFMGAERVLPLVPPRLEVHTSIEIDAPPQEVWQRLISFPDLPEPEDWLFRFGVGYPIRATLQGSGAGALRQCLFSTGTYVEPIEVWNEPKVLEFSVLSEPPPLRELTPYADIHPRHLDGYFQPERAQFLLTSLPLGRTHLEGVSWYRNHMWPASYWRLWSDLIVHHIHLRVFNHIKRLAEHRELSRLSPGRLSEMGKIPQPNPGGLK